MSFSCGPSCADRCPAGGMVECPGCGEKFTKVGFRMHSCEELRMGGPSDSTEGYDGPPVLELREDIEKLLKSEKTIGPKEDPYALETYTVVFKSGRRIHLEIDSLAHAWRLYGDGIGKIEEDPFDPLHDQVRQRIQREFLEETGLDVWSFNAHYYAGQEKYDGGRAAEAAAGWDPNP